MSSNRSLRVDNAQEVQEMIYSTLANSESVAREIVAFNAGSARTPQHRRLDRHRNRAGARSDNLSGAARAKLDEFVRFTQGFST